jgi:iron-sulfur cluster assembly protein
LSQSGQSRRRVTFATRNPIPGIARESLQINRLDAPSSLACALHLAWQGNIATTLPETTRLPEGERAMIQMTDNAVKAVRRFIKGAGKPVAGLRIAITGGGCSGFQYDMKLEEAIAEGDTVVDCGSDLKVFIDPASAGMLGGVIVDFVETLDGAGFKFENPNASNTCGCGKSFS